MASVYTKQGTPFLYVKWINEHGKEQRASTRTADPVKARAMADEIERRLARAKTPASPLLPGAGPTVRSFVEETWLPLRRQRRKFAWKTDESRLEHHFLPEFGDRALADLATDDGEVELLDWLTVRLPTHPAKRDGKPIAARTVWNVASVVSVLFADARERRVIPRDPTAVWDAARHLPPKRDKNPGWRANAYFRLDEVVALTTDPRVPEDRRVLYAVRYLGGLRPGEAANLRWRDLDRTVEPLPRLTVSSAFNSAYRVEKETKTGAVMQVPVHPVLDAVLAAWEREGWARFIGRPQTPSDLLIPAQSGQQRLVQVTREAFLRDLAVLGLPPRRQYESRATFRNLARAHGAPKDMVNQITHPSPEAAADHYDRVEVLWPAMCRAVLAIPADPWASLVPAVVPERGPGKEKARQLDEGWRAQMVTRTGFEPMFSA
jgi:integrase